MVQQTEKPATADPTKTHLEKAHKHGSPLVACRFDPSGRFVFFAAQDLKIWRWEIESDKKTELVGHDSWVRGMAFHSDGKTMLSGGFDGRLIWWSVEAEKPEPLRKIDAHAGWVRGVAVSPDNSLIATCGNDKRVKLWRMDDGSLVREMTGHERHIYNVAFHPDGKQLASGDLMGNLFHWEVETGTLVRKMHIAALHKYDKTFKADIGGFRDMTFNADGSLLASAGITNVTNAFAGVGNPLIELWDWQAGEQKIQHLSKAKLRGVAWGVALHPQPFTIGLSGGGGGGFLLFWKQDQKEEFHQFKLPNTARGLSLSPDGLRIATAHYDGHLRISKMAAKAS